MGKTRTGQCEGYQVWNSLSKDVENIGELN